MKTNLTVLAATFALITATWMGCGGGDGEDETVVLDAGTDAVSLGRLPCEVEAVLKARCQECHQSPTANGAPFPLLTYGNTQADYFGTPVYERMKAAIESDFMPPDPREKLGAEDRAALLDWIDEGAPPAEAGEACP